ncbi:MAG TPA: hypothetical protein VGC74_16895 [Stenotrophomonas sp.]
MSSWSLLGKGYEKIPLLAAANLRGDYPSTLANVKQKEYEAEGMAIRAKSFWRRVLVYQIGYVLAYALLFVILHFGNVANAGRAAFYLFLAAQVALVLGLLIDYFFPQRR